MIQKDASPKARETALASPHRRDFLVFESAEGLLAIDAFDVREVAPLGRVAKLDARANVAILRGEPIPLDSRGASSNAPVCVALRAAVKGRARRAMALGALRGLFLGAPHDGPSAEEAWVDLPDGARARVVHWLDEPVAAAEPVDASPSAGGRVCVAASATEAGRALAVAGATAAGLACHAAASNAAAVDFAARQLDRLFGLLLSAESGDEDGYSQAARAIELGVPPRLVAIHAGVVAPNRPMATWVGAGSTLDALSVEVVSSWLLSLEVA